MLIMCPRVLCTHVFMSCIILEAELLSCLVALLSEDFIVHIFVCVCVHVLCHGVCGKSTTCRSQFFSSICVLGTELRSPGLVTRAFTC